MAYGESPLDERRVRRDLPAAYNRLTLVLKALGRDDEALAEIDRAAALGILERDDCGRKADREALRHRSRRLRERRDRAGGKADSRFSQTGKSPRTNKPSNFASTASCCFDPAAEKPMSE